MIELKYRDFHEYLVRLQKRIHLFLVVPIPIFVYLIIRLENGSVRPLVIDENVVFYLRNFLTAVSLVIIILSVLIFGGYSRRMARGSDLRSKLNGYFKASLMREIFLELIFVANLAGLAITGEKYYARLSGIILVVFLLGYPNSQRIINTLKLDEKESETILSNGNIV